MDLYRRKERTGDEKIQEWVNEWSEPKEAGEWLWAAESAGACVVNFEITDSICSKVLQWLAGTIFRENEYR